MNFIFGAAIEALWVLFFVYWIVAARRVNRMRTKEPAAERLMYLLVLVLAVVLFDYGGARFGVLHRRFVPRSYWIAIAGVALTAAGIVFAIWARRHIGQFWSASVSIREGHQIVRSGPYSRIRHPIYTGLLIAVAGSALAFGELAGVAAFVVVLAGLTFKASKEEALLAREFGASFADHRRHTGFFLPRFS